MFSSINLNTTYNSASRKANIKVYLMCLHYISSCLTHDCPTHVILAYLPLPLPTATSNTGVDLEIRTYATAVIPQEQTLRQDSSSSVINIKPGSRRSVFTCARGFQPLITLRRTWSVSTGAKENRIASPCVATRHVCYRRQGAVQPNN